MKKAKILTASDVRTIVKEEIQPFRQEVHAEFFTFRKEFDDFKEEIRGEFTQFRSEVMTSIDKIVGMFGKHNEEHEILAGRHKQILELDDRIDKLEKIHPHSQHPLA